MNFLIEIYDNFLIYYPNIFFPFLFLLSIVGIFLLFRLIIFLNKKSRRIAREIKINLSKIIVKKRVRIKIVSSKFTISIFYPVKVICNSIAKISNIFEHLKLRIKKIIARIKKEVLID